jgi:HAD superfamily 5'-nucleotidase-like hydrolase
MNSRAVLPLVPPQRARNVFCNRTLNLRAIRAIGYDMDYTLIHYQVAAWELRAYEHIKRRLLADGWPVESHIFDPQLVTRGLIIDTELGNIVKANRFGYVKRAFHGTRPLDFEDQHRTYARTIVDLAEERWSFMNTFFSLSEGCFYAQLVDLLDQRKLPEVLGYPDLLRRVRACLDAAHMEGELKAEISAAPERFLVLDPEAPLALLDQRHAGKKLMLITNSEWGYTRSMMSYGFDRFLPSGMSWRDLFDVIIVEARKPEFFLDRNPLFEVVNDKGLLKPALAGLKEGGVFLGGDAPNVEKFLGLSGDEILYVGDHMWGDVHVSKSVLRWRTALVVRELESEIEALDAFAPQQARLRELMAEKEREEKRLCELRLAVLRKRAGYGPRLRTSTPELERESAAVRERLAALDAQIGPLAQAAGEVGNSRWGPLMRAGNDKSHLARQIENYADIYTSRVSNLLWRSPFAYLRSHQGNLPHDLPT